MTENLSTQLEYRSLPPEATELVDSLVEMFRSFGDWLRKSQQRVKKVVARPERTGLLSSGVGEYQKYSGLGPPPPLCHLPSTYPFRLFDLTPSSGVAA